MNREGSIICIHNIYFTAVKSVYSCGTVPSGELYKYLQILLTSWRQSSGRPLEWIEGRSTQYTRGNWRNWVCFPLPTGFFLDKPTSSETYTQKVASHRLQQMTHLNIRKRILPLQVEQVLLERPQDLHLLARPSTAWSAFEDGLVLTTGLE